jgi:hypothetical protein
MNLIAKEGVVKAAFSCKTKDLREVLKFLKAGLKKTWMKERLYCEITVITNEVQFAVNGARKSLFCQAKGPARVTISFAYFLHLVQDRPRIQIKIAIGDDFMMVNETTVAITTCFFQDDSILRSIDLPVNYGIADILRLPLRYTQQEIEFNKRTADHKGACATLNYDTKLIASRLKKYGISKDEVEKFIYEKIFKELKYSENDTNKF